MADEITNAVRSRIRTFHEGSFDQHASIEAVDAAIKDADAAQTALGRHVGWLQGVKRQRKVERTQAARLAEATGHPLFPHERP